MKVIRRRWEKNWPELRAAIRGGLPGFVLAERPGELGAEVPVFCYHAVDRETLEADLRFLRANRYVTLDADGLLDHLHGTRPAPSRAVVLSFDDGGSSLYHVVFELLRSYSQRAVAFISPRFHADACRCVRGEPSPCTWNEIRRMHASGFVDFQSHTLEHRYVPRWPEPVPLTGVALDYLGCLDAPLSIEEDLRLSREALENTLGKPVQHLAFPRFDGTADAVRVGQRTGYRGFWWGMQPGQPLNQPGDDGTRIVRLSGEFLRRLPGRGRRPLATILRTRYLTALRSWVR